MEAHQAPLSLGFSRQEYWSGLPFPSPMDESESEVTQLCPTLSDPMDCSLPGLSTHGIFQARVLEWVAIAFSTNVMLHGERLKGFPLGWGTRQVCPFSTFLLNRVLKVLARAIRQQKENKCNAIRKEEFKLFLWTWHDFIYRKILTIPPKNWYITNKSRKVNG